MVVWFTGCQQHCLEGLLPSIIWPNKGVTQTCRGMITHDHLKMSFHVYWERITQKMPLEATLAACEGDGGRDMMKGDMTHLLLLGCPGWPSCLTESCWLPLRLNPTSPVSLSLWREWYGCRDKTGRGKQKESWCTTAGRLYFPACWKCRCFIFCYPSMKCG